MKLYRGTTTQDRGLRGLLSGNIPQYTWLTTNPAEARAYAELKVKGGHGRTSGGQPVILEFDVPDPTKTFWVLGGGGFHMQSKYYKAHHLTRARVRKIR